MSFLIFLFNLLFNLPAVQKCVKFHTLVKNFLNTEELVVYLYPDNNPPGKEIEK